MSPGDFQFLSGLLEVCVALNLGFAISPGFRSLPRRKFDAIYLVWNSLQTKESDRPSSKNDEITTNLAKTTADVISKGANKEASAVSRCLVVGVLSVVLLAFVVAVPIFALFDTIPDKGIYTVTYLLTMLGLVNVGLTYGLLLYFWKNEFTQLDNGCKKITGKSIEDHFPNS